MKMIQLFFVECDETTAMDIFAQLYAYKAVNLLSYNLTSFLIEEYSNEAEDNYGEFNLKMLEEDIDKFYGVEQSQSTAYSAMNDLAEKSE